MNFTCVMIFPSCGCRCREMKRMHRVVPLKLIALKGVYSANQNSRLRRYKMSLQEKISILGNLDEKIRSTLTGDDIEDDII